MFYPSHGRQTLLLKSRKIASALLAIFLILESFLVVTPQVAEAAADESELTRYPITNVSLQSATNQTGNTGNFHYDYPIELPAVQEAITPSISLAYDSSSRSSFSIYGYSWSDSIPYISLMNKNGSRKLYSEPVYYFSELGELVPSISSTTFTPKVESGSFMTIEKVGDVWEVTDKSGTTYTFGSSTASRGFDPSDSSRIYKWMLTDVVDTNGNSVAYSYVKDDEHVYPLTITYGEQNLYRVVFGTTSVDTRISYAPSFRTEQNYLISDISLYAEDDLVKKYSLDYSNGLLDSITLSTYEGSSPGVKPSTDFTYTDETGAAGWSNDTDFDISVNTSLFDSYDNIRYLQFPDLNGDGLSDAFLLHTRDEYSDPTLWAALNTGDGWDVLDSSDDFLSTLPTDVTDCDLTSRLDFANGRLTDVNGDGLTDLVCLGNPYEEVYLNTGEGWSYSSKYTYSAGGYHKHIQFADIDGDGLPDSMIHYLQDQNPGDPIPRTYIRLNKHGSWTTSGTGGWVNSAPTSTAADFFSVDLGAAGGRLADVNNDGLADFVVTSEPQGNGEYTLKVYLNTSTAWEYDSSFDLEHDLVYGRFMQFVDLNGDGLQDIYLLHNNPNSSSTNKPIYVALNTGSGWNVLSVSHDLIDDVPGSVYNPDFAVTNYNASNYPNGRLADINGDGLADLIHTDNYVADIYVNTGGYTNLLSNINDPIGGTVTVTYTTPQEQGNDSVPYALPIVATKQFDSGFGNIWTETYSYSQGSHYYDEDDYRDRKFAGFGQVTKTTDQGKEISYFHQGNGNSTTTDEVGDDAAKIGYSYRTDVADLSDNLLSSSVSRFATTSLGATSTYVSLSSTVALQYDGDGDHKDAAKAYEYDSIGNLITLTEYGEVTGSLDGSYTDSGSDKRTTEYTYATNTDNMSVVSSEVLKDNSNATVSESEYYYDGLSLGSVGSFGNLTSKVDWIADSSYATSSWTYDQYGNVLSETDPRGNTTLFEYDTYDLFVASSTNAAGLNTQYEYDYAVGKIGTTTLPTGEVSVTTYDKLGRPLAVYQPESGTGNQVLVSEYEYNDARGSVSVGQTAYLNGSLTQTIHQYYDGFNNLIQQRVEAEDVNQYVVQDYVYGTNNQLASESLPYFGSGSSRTASTTDSDLYTTYTYDALGRVVVASTTVGATYTTRDQWTETVTDPLGNEKDFTYDAYGRLAQVTEHNGASSYDTIYEWDENDNLTKIIDDLGNVRNITYDGLSRRTALEDLHASTDTSFGTWYFDYDAAGNVSSTTDPNGQTVNYTYDDINRVLTENYIGESGDEVTYGYDSCTLGAGKLCSVADNSATSTYTYDHAGNTASETKTIAGTGYTTEYEYDRQGNQTLITYQDDSEVKYTYNAANKIETVEQREDGGSFSDIVSDFDYGPHGLVTYQLDGNGASTTKTYDEDELYRLRSIVTTATSTYGVGGGGPDLALIESEYDLMLASDESSTVETEVSEGESVVVETEEIPEAGSEPIDTAEVVVSENETSPIQEASVESLENSVVQEDVVSEPQSVESVDPGPYTEASDRYIIKGGKSDLKDDEVTVEIKKTEPKVRFKKWNNNVDVGVEYSLVSKAAEKENGNEKIKWKDVAQEVHAYPLSESASLPNGGFEIEVQLNEKPKSNKFTFALDGYENLDFFYQPPLDEEPAEGETCTEFECTEDETGEVTRVRGENVVGSYAIYHKDKKGQFENETNYGSGKVFHIYRPHIVDANGDEVWGELDIDDGELIVTVPQNFLAQAEYPVIVDPTFGYTSAGGSTATVRYDFRGSLFTSPSDYGSFDSMTIYCDTLTGSYELKGMIVNHSSLNIVSNGVSDEEICTTTGAWKTLTFSSAPSLSASTEYLLGGISNNTRAQLHYDSGATNQGHFDGTNSYISPQNLGSVTHDTNKYSAYITYTASGGGGNATPTAPTSLETEGQTNPTNITDSTPEFTAIYNDPDSGDSAVYYEIEVDDDSGFGSPIWDSGKTSLTTTTEGNRTGDITYGGTALASSTTYYWRIKFWDDDDAEGAWSTVTATFSLAAGGGGPTNATPTAPTSLETEAQTNPTDITDSTPEFSAIYNDPDSGDSAVYYQIQVDDDSGFGSTIWDSTKTALTSVTEGNRSGDITYSGTALASSTTYYWRIKFWDDDDAEGAWSTVTATFSLEAAAPTFPEYNGVIQHLTYTYDAVGNITQIVDNSQTDTAATTTYAYDDLYRLTSAATSQASTTPYSRTYTYNALGNILTKSDQTGTYSYAGSSGTNYANPHAVTSIGTVGYTYDHNGNLLSVDDGPLNSWTYNNRLLTSAVNGATSTYAYDHSGARVAKAVSTGTSGGGAASSTGFRSPAATGDDYDEWYYGAPENAYASDDDYASGASHSMTDEQDYYNFSLDVPSGATIDGIELQVEFKAAYNKTDSLEAKLSWDGGSSQTTMKSQSWSNEEEVYKSYGGATDTWGRTWSSTELTNTNFRVYFHQPANWYGSGVDHVRLNVYYSTSGGGGTETTTTYYPFTNYEVSDTGTTTKHIYAGDQLIATIEDDTPAPKTYYNHLDHLNGTNVSTDQYGYTTNVYSYYPFGDNRIETDLASFSPTHQFTDYYRDNETDLLYLGARYYNSGVGRFTSMDPMLLDIGTGSFNSDWMKDPQSLNTYSYVRNNPLNKVDLNGESWQTFGQGIMSPVTYVYHHPLQTLGVVAVTGAAVVAAPVAAAVAGAGLGGFAIGTAGYNAATAPDADTRDYYLGQGASETLLTALGIKGASVANSTLRTGAVTESTRIHGNSLNSPKLNYLYQLVDRDTNETLKFGITGRDNPLHRYTKAQYKEMNADMKIMNTGSRRDMAGQETQQIKKYEAENGKKPKLNKNYH